MLTDVQVRLFRPGAPACPKGVPARHRWVAPAEADVDSARMVLHIEGGKGRRTETSCSVPDCSRSYGIIAVCAITGGMALPRRHASHRRHSDYRAEGQDGFRGNHGNRESRKILSTRGPGIASERDRKSVV